MADILFGLDPKTSRCSYLEIYLNIMYTLAIVPFKVERNKLNGEYFLARNKPQQCVSVLVYLAFIAGTFGYQSINTEHLYNPMTDMSKLLRTTGYLAGTAISLVATRAVWLDQENIVYFLNNSKVSSFAGFMSLGIIKTFVTAITLFFYMVMIVFSIWLDPTLIKATETCNTWLIKILESIPIIGYGSKTFEYMLIFIYAQGYAVYTLPRSMLIVLLLQLKGIGLQFEKFMEEHGSHLSTDVVIDEYESLQKTVQCASSWAGGILQYGIVWTLSFVPNIPAAIRDIQAGRLALWHPIFYSGTVAVFLLVGCELPKQVKKTCKKWINMKQRQTNLSPEEKLLLLAFAQEVNTGDPVGLSCSFFTLTHGFFASMVSLLATYGVIVFQTPVHANQNSLA